MNNIIETYENLPKVVKIILQIFFGGIIACVYRIIRFTETKKTATLVFGIIGIIPTIGIIPQIVDIVTEVTKNRITYLAD